VVIDLPAHGIEAGGSTHAFEMADAIEIAGNALGKVDIVVAHSLGAMATAVAMQSSLKADRLVLLAPGLLPHQALESFAAILRLRPVVAKAVEHSTITPETRRDLLGRAGIIPEVNALVVPLIW
jgi:pimeloyl-ACP methyl ester carboxylesterase